MNRIAILIFPVLFIFSACNNSGVGNVKSNDGEIVVKEISESAKLVRDYLKTNIVIAHRGSTFWVPEETEAAYRWARNIGADYLELDVQLTKDNVLVAFHDKYLSRTTNIATVYPDSIKPEVNDFTLKELRTLDAGSWFNSANPEREKESFIDLKILTLTDVVMIAEGNRIKANNGMPEKEIVEGEWTGNYVYEKDSDDNGHRPGIYIETKQPKAKVEKILAEKIIELGWNINEDPKEIKVQAGKVNIANTNARLILQSFSQESIKNLEEYLPNIPKCFLIGRPKMDSDLKTKYTDLVNFAVDNNVHIIGPSISWDQNKYGEFTAEWMQDMIHSSGMQIHPYTFDTLEQLNTYKGRVEGVFTNRADLALEFYNRKGNITPEEFLVELGYY